jgi:hypothetical protein
MPDRHTLNCWLASTSGPSYRPTARRNGWPPRLPAVARTARLHGCCPASAH